MRNVRYILVVLAVCVAMLGSCEEPVSYGTATLLVSGSTGSKSIGPGSSAAVAKVLFGGTRSDGTKLGAQAVDLSTGKGEVSGITVGTWTFTATGLNADGDVVTEKAEKEGVVIVSGKSTAVAFTLRYLASGTGRYRVTVGWPEALPFKGVSADLGGTAVAGTASGGAAVFSGSLPVGDYGVGVEFTNPSGTVVSFPNLEVVNVFSGLESVGAVTLEGADFVRAATPVVGTSDVSGGKRVTLGSATGGAAVYYTTDGTDPASSGTRVAYASPFTLRASATVRAIAAKDGLVDSSVASSEVAVSQVATPVVIAFDAIGGKSMEISCSTGGSTIYYTTDGSTPSTSSTKYGSAFALTSGATVKAYALKSGMVDSAVVSKDVTVSQVATPVISPARCAFNGSLSVTISCGTSGATIHYTTDGTDPTTLSATYTGAFTVSTTTTVKAIAVKSGMANSGVCCVVYTLKPVFAVGDVGPAGGIVFYDKGSYSDGWRYLEAAPSDDGMYVWGGYGTAVGSTGTAIGTGKANTVAIVAKFGATEPYQRKMYAAKVCADKTVTNNGTTYNDWFLPSLDELHEMYLQREKIGGFAESCSYYWSSSEWSDENAFNQRFPEDGTGNYYKYYIYVINYPIYVRAIRAF